MSTVNDITYEDFGTAPSGEPVKRFTLSNSNGLIVKITNFGGIVTNIIHPDKDGNLEDVVLGFDTLEPYVADTDFYIGATVGRYANRIANAKFTLDGREFILDKNNGENNLHGGIVGFNKAVWSSQVVTDGEVPVLELTHLSPDGDQGFPGELRVSIRFYVTADNKLSIDYSATTDKPTVVNLTHHGYFNLAGKGDILSHQLTLNADSITPVDENTFPLEELMPVEDTPLDFRSGKKLGDDIESADTQIQLARGYDHNFILNKTSDAALDLAATVIEYSSGRVLKVYTTEPAVQLYTGNYLDGVTKGKGVTFQPRGAFCLEPQHYPNSPNREDFPSTVLRPGETYKSQTSFEFTTLAS